MTIPTIKNDNGIATLYVNDEPFFALAGELHNSSASCLSYLEESVWPMLKGLNMNSVIAPIYWESVEPSEGVYDFSSIDGLIKQARRHDFKLILLWFGLWKNAESMYIPGWMKQDSTTYFRIKKINGEPVNTISPLCESAIKKDADCFSAIMAHIRDIDEKESTVIAVQIENEIGVLGSSRDFGKQANALFFAPVPVEMQEFATTSGNWQESFGEDAEEYFMAYHFAKAVGEISKAGQSAFPLPCYANAWLKQYPWYPGSYPSGGPIRDVHKIWKKFAPNLFTLAPDIYVSNVADIFDEYSYDTNPLFVPEVRKDAVAASYCMYAFGRHNAICFSPFGIEELALDPAAIDKPPMEVMMALNIDPTAFDITGSKDYLSKTYDMITQMKPLLLKYRGSSHLKSYCRHGETDFGVFLKFGAYDIAVSYAPRMQAKPLAAGIVFELDADTFLIAGMMSTFEFKTKPEENLKAEIQKLEEGHIQNGSWIPKRTLNGDEKMMIKFGDMPNYFMVKLFKY